MKDNTSILIQCDFDGTVTEEDASFAILDACTPGSYQTMFQKYQEGRMTLGEFNNRAFSRVKADRETLLGIVRDRIKVRKGFREFVDYCRYKGFEFVIVSNGLDFYIYDILERLSISGIDVFASITEFRDSGLSVRHKGPDGEYLDNEVKAAFTDYYLSRGYRIIYLGDGKSDVSPARRSHHVFATGSLIEHCRTENLECTPFSEFLEVIRVIESWR